MKYIISSNKVKSARQTRKAALKWSLYSVILTFFYSLMRSGAFGLWQPFLIIPLAVSVALFERELPSCFFALFSGYLIDTACRFIFGFSVIWLMLSCLAASLLSRNLIRVNVLNFFWISALSASLEFFMGYLFNVFIWDVENRSMILEKSVFPSLISTLLASPLVFLLIRLIYGRLSGAPPVSNYSPDEDSDGEETKSKVRL